MTEHLRLQIYDSEAEARGLKKKPAIVANDTEGIQAALRICAKWGVPPDVVECIVHTYNDDDPEDEMTESQGNLREYAACFDIPTDEESDAMAQAAHEARKDFRNR